MSVGPTPARRSQPLAGRGAWRAASPERLFARVGALWRARTAAPASTAHRGAYRPDIDGLRAIAVLSVVLYHIGLGVTPGGFVGVDIFFVISGYVISRSLVADLQKGQFSVTGFYERRVRRIFPALFVVMMATSIASAVLFLPSYLVDYSRSLIGAATFTSNFYFWKNSGYFANGANLRPLLHTWSLAIEEQFYIFAPLTLFAIHRYARKRWLLVLAPAALASLGLSIWATDIGPTANFFLLPMRAWELLLGAVLALRPPPQLRWRWLRELLAVGGLALLAWPVFFYTSATPFPGLAAVPPCAGAALLIYLGSGAGSWVTRLLSLPPLVAVGLISYSLYLVHWPIVSFVTYCDLRAPVAADAGWILAASLVLATLSWRFVEQPFRNRNLRLPRWAWLGGGAAAMALAAGVGLAGVATQGLPGRFPRSVERESQQPSSLGRDNVCFLGNNPHLRSWNAAACTITHGGGGRVLLWGDSYAAHYVAGIETLASAIPYTIIQYTAAGCPPVLSYSAYNRPNCQRFNQNAISIIRRNHIGAVVLAARWVDLQRRGLGELDSTLDALARLGVTVYVIGQSPMFTADVHIIALRQGADRASGAWPISFAPDLNRRLAAVVGRDRFIDPLAHLCTADVCPYRADGRLLYADEGHFSVPGSVQAVASYFPLLERPELTRAADRRGEGEQVFGRDASHPLKIAATGLRRRKAH